MDDQTKSTLLRQLPKIAIGLAIVVGVFIFFGKGLIFLTGKLIVKIVSVIAVAIGSVFGLRRQKK